MCLWVGVQNVGVWGREPPADFFQVLFLLLLRHWVQQCHLGFKLVKIEHKKGKLWIFSRFLLREVKVKVRVKVKGQGQISRSKVKVKVMVKGQRSTFFKKRKWTVKQVKRGFLVKVKNKGQGQRSRSNFKVKGQGQGQGQVQRSKVNFL